MRRVAATLLVVLCATVLSAADDVGRIVGGVEAVYHEGVVTFTVIHPEAVSACVKVYDLATDALVFDSGPRARTQLTWQAGRDFKGGTRYLVTAWNAEGEVVVSQTAANKRQAPISEISFDTVPENTTFAGVGEIDMLGDVFVGPTPGVGLFQDYGGAGFGGGVVVYGDSTFDKRVYMSADGVAGAGYFRLNSPVGGLWIDGAQHLHGNEAALSFYGGTSEFQFFAGETGTDSVVMPTDAVSATEIENEPGVASEYATATVGTLVGIPTTVVTASITAPTDGYVFAAGFVEVRVNHASGIDALCFCSISETQDVMYGDGSVRFAVAQDSPSGGYGSPISLTRIVPVSVGTKEIHMVCTKSTSDYLFFENRRLDLLFVPTAYGTVSVSRD